MSQSSMTYLDIHAAARALRAGSISPVDLTQACLNRIERLDKKLNSFITVTSHQALAAARRAESELASGFWRGPLHGIPVAVKDNIDTAGVLTTAASAVFADRVPHEDAEVVRRLKEAGAILLGKLNMHEFALGTTSAISHTGPVRNPWNPDLIAGGSSGGAGAAVAAGFCFGAVGTDTGGSIRIPAACCGIVGLKPTFGVVSLQGTILVSASFDHVGPMCRTVADTVLMFRAMTDHQVGRHSEVDATSPVSQLRIGVLDTSAWICDAAVDPEIQSVFDSAIDVLRPLVAEVRPADLPMPDLGRLIGAEVYALHARFMAERPQQYDARTRATILRGQGISSAESGRLRQDLERFRALSPEVFSRVDLVIVPTLPMLPMRIEDATDPFALPSCSFAFSMGGWPSLSVPCGYSRSGLPVGLLIGGPPFAEPHIFALAQVYERVTAWHSRRPPVD